MEVCRVISYLCTVNMTYPERIEQKIGFDAVRDMVAAYCGSQLARDLVGEMQFSDSFDEVASRLGRVAEMKTILEGDDAFPGAVIRDITLRLKSVRPDGTFLTAGEFVDLAVTLESIAAIVKFFDRHRRDDGSSEYPGLDRLADGLVALPALSREIDRAIDRSGEVKDNASPALADVRRRLQSMGGTIAATMRRVIANGIRDGILDPDTAPAMRDGRLVMPVAPMNKRRVRGIVHDESASGKTVFIEPDEVVEANNRLRELQIEEQREVVKVLVALTAAVRPEINTILDCYDLLAQFDFIQASASFARDCGGTLPHIQPGPMMEWYRAVHPVLRRSLMRHGKEVVPLDISLSPENRILVISGPNAGGKSVTLKTVAVVQYMLQCGLLPPLDDNSHAGIFENIFIDIGDDQSIEDDLSTYSSHLRNMKFFMARGNSDTLILIDEFGAGTEPQIGGAIAQALLAEFNSRGMWGVVTTHFQNLKKFAGETAGLVNGSMLYDRQAMKPLFRLSIGNPGSSFAIEIARKTGLPESIIAAAGEIVGSDYINLDKYLLDIARDRRYWENKRMQIRAKEKKIEDTLQRYDADAETLRENRSRILAEARDEARKILEGSNAAIERAILDIRRSQAEREATLEARRRLEQEKADITAEGAEHPLLKPKSRRRKKTEPQATSESADDKRPLQPGDNVLLDGHGTVGVIRSVTGKKAEVVFGQLLTTVDIKRLSRTLRKASSGIAKAASFVSAATADDSRERQLNFKPEIDVRGMRVDEAIQAVTYFIDDAVQFNSQRVRILHGTGTGALRQYIRQYLATVPAVRHFADEDVRLGGAGITVVEF